MPQAIIKCNCGKTACVEHNGSLNIGDVSRDTNFFYVILNDGDCAWLCTDCFKKAQEIAVTLYNLIGKGHIHFPQFLPKEIRDKMYD